MLETITDVISYFGRKGSGSTCCLLVVYSLVISLQLANSTFVKSESSDNSGIDSDDVLV